MNNYNGFKGIIENIISEREMVEPTAQKFENFISENNLEKKEFEKEVSGIKFNVTAYYINSELFKLEVLRNNAQIYNGNKGNVQFAGFVSQLSNQLNINL